MMRRQVKPKRNKHGNVKTEVDGVIIDSKHEAKVLRELRVKLRAGEIDWLATQVELQLGPTRKMVIDFLYHDGEGLHWLDAKGYATPDWKTKQAWAKTKGYDIETI